MKNIVFLTLFVLPFLILAQNVGVNNSNPDNSAQLDITSASKGLLIPRMTEAARLAIVNPAHSLMVYQTDGQYGYYYNNGSTVSPSWLALGTSLNTWAIGGNTLNATGAFGSKSNNHVDFLSNNVVRGRLTNLGEFFVGATNTTIAGDLLGAVGNSTFPFAVNGYSSFNGCGVYGAITGGTTTFAAVQGEYQSAASGPYNTAGVKGSNQSSVPGTAFRSLSASGPRVGVFGNTTNANGQYTFGVHGSMGSSDIRCGGVIGDDFGFALGALGYYAASLTDYSVYGFGNAYQVGVAGGRTSAPEPNTQIGLGIYGGVMGGWIRGLVYGTHLKGEIYGLYVDGKTYTNQPIAELVATDAEARVPVYTAVSSQPEVYDKGKATTVGGAGKVEFNEIFRSMADFDDVVITVTPLGPSSGLFIESQDESGFVVRENGKGATSVKFSWIAIASRKGFDNIDHANEILNKSFDETMNNVMFNDNNKKDKPTPIWYDGKKVRFDNPPAKKVDGSYSPSTRVIID